MSEGIAATIGGAFVATIVAAREVVVRYMARRDHIDDNATERARGNTELTKEVLAEWRSLYEAARTDAAEARSEAAEAARTCRRLETEVADLRVRVDQCEREKIDLRALLDRFGGTP